MLVLSRKKNESIVINGNIRIEILQIKGKQIRIGITAPSSMKVLRGELPEKARRASNVASDRMESRPTTKRLEPKPKQKNESESTEQLVVDCNLHDLVSAVMASA